MCIIIYKSGFDKIGEMLAFWLNASFTYDVRRSFQKPKTFDFKTGTT